MPEVSSLLTLHQAAKLLGIGYERVRALVAAGRLPAVDLPGFGRRIRRRDLLAFQKIPRPRGRPRLSRRLYTGPGTVDEMFARVQERTGSLPTLSSYRALVKFRFLPPRREFPRGEYGKRLCLALQCRRLTAITLLRHRHVTTYRDFALGLKFSSHHVDHDLLCRAMLSYLYSYKQARQSVTEDDLEPYILNESDLERPPRFVRRLSRLGRERAYRGITKLWLGRPLTHRDMETVRDAVGLSKESLPDRDSSGQQPGLSWTDLFRGIQDVDVKIDKLLDEAIIGPQHRGRRQVILYRSFCAPDELDRAWQIARLLVRIIFPTVRERLHGLSPRAHVYYVNATLVKTVTFCHIQLCEQGDTAFLPFNGELAPLNTWWLEACVRLMVAPPPEPVASLVRQVMTEVPKSDQERRLILFQFERVARSEPLPERDRRIVETMLRTIRRPSKKKIRAMLATLETLRAPIR